MTKPVVLFVDNDSNVIEGFMRMVKVLNPDWEARYAASGVECLVVMAKTSVAAVVANLTMPGMTGLELLQRVQSLHPGVVRIILSSESDSESDEIFRATQFVHQFLLKPCKSEVLQAIISRALRLRNLLSNAEVIKVVSGIPYLPSLPPLYNQLTSALESPNTSLTEIGDIIAKDVSMTGRVLHLVNSAFFGLPRKISKPQEAAVFLGVSTLKSLILYGKLFFSAGELSIRGLTLDDLWAHSSQTAFLAKEIMAAEGAPKRVQEDAMAAGMMHDVGKLLILDVKGYVSRVLFEMDSGKNFAEAEYSRFSTSHAEIGGYLLGIWGLPDTLVEAVTCHHRPRQIPQTEFSLLTGVHVANAFLSSESGDASLVDREYISAIHMENRLPVWQKLAASVKAKMKRQ